MDSVYRIRDFHSSRIQVTMNTGDFSAWPSVSADREEREERVKVCVGSNVARTAKDLSRLGETTLMLALDGPYAVDVVVKEGTVPSVYNSSLSYSLPGRELYEMSAPCSYDRVCDWFRFWTRSRNDCLVLKKRQPKERSGKRNPRIFCLLPFFALLWATWIR